MRDLFLSEARFIENMILREGIGSVRTPDRVAIEYYAPPRTSKAISFNSDFFLQFVEMEDLKDFRSVCCPVRPNTMGAEVFLTLDKMTGAPLRAELIAGEAFEAEYFSSEIERIEREVSRTGISVNIAQSKYARVFIVENEICFLVFPDEPEPTMRGKRVALTEGIESSIMSYVARDKLVCVDGWIKTEVAASEWFLVAEPEDRD